MNWRDAVLELVGDTDDGVRLCAAPEELWAYQPLGRLLVFSSAYVDQRTLTLFTCRCVKRVRHLMRVGSRSAFDNVAQWADGGPDPEPFWFGETSIDGAANAAVQMLLAVPVNAPHTAIRCAVRATAYVLDAVEDGVKKSVSRAAATRSADAARLNEIAAHRGIFCSMVRAPTEDDLIAAATLRRLGG